MYIFGQNSARRKRAALFRPNSMSVPERVFGAKEYRLA